MQLNVESGDARRNRLLTGSMRTRDPIRCLLLEVQNTQVDVATLKIDNFVFLVYGFGRFPLPAVIKREYTQKKNSGSRRP